MSSHKDEESAVFYFHIFNFILFFYFIRINIIVLYL